MPREVPNCPEQPNVERKDRSYVIELITPMFGGGVEPRVNDLRFPIRPTAIRGQLQFWWRATVGAQYATGQKLRDAQSEIWGSTEQASQVQVPVEYGENEIGPPIPCAHYDYKPPRGQRSAKHELVWNEPFSVPEKRHWGTEYVPKDLTYALFPFQGEKAARIEPGCKPKVAPASAIHAAKFRLVVRCPNDLWPQVEPAIWAWVNFGGLGSRTRRGCGAIFCDELAPKDAADLAAMWKRYMPELYPLCEWPTLAEVMLAATPIDSAIEAWDQAIGKLRFFRQGEKFARDPGNPPSRSRFPEPDTIRRITESWSPGHQPRQLEEIPDGFPRAEFGLPIVFHFKDGKRNANDTRPLEPFDTVLQPFFAEMTEDGPKLDADGFPVGVTKERMASPLILKPVRLVDGKSIPLILRLSAILPQRVELQDIQGECLTHRRAVPVRHPSFASGDSPINKRSKLGSALEAFLKYAALNGFPEVKR